MALVKHKILFWRFFKPKKYRHFLNLVMILGLKTTLFYIELYEKSR